MMPQLGAPVGFIAANGFFLALGAWLTPDLRPEQAWDAAAPDFQALADQLAP